MQVHVWTGSKYVPEGVLAQEEVTPLEAAKTAKRVAIDRAYNQNLNEGYHDATLGITVAATQNDQNIFGNFVTKHILQETPSTETITIADNGGTFQQMTYAQFKTMMMGYGDWCEAQWGGAAYARQLVEAAATIEEIEAIIYE